MTTTDMPMPELPPELIDAQYLPLLGFLATGWVAGVERGRADMQPEIDRLRVRNAELEDALTRAENEAEALRR